MSDDATLRDAIVSETKPAEEVKETSTEKAETPRILDAPNPDAAEIGRIILESGYSKEQLNDLLNAPRALDAMRHAIQNNPQEFLNMLDRTDPKTGEKFLESMADTYVHRYGDKAKPSGKSGKDDTNTELMREVESLREQTNRLLTEQQRRDQAAALAATRQRYDSRVDDLFSHEGVKELGLKKSEVKAMRAQLDVELSRDPAIVQRISSGNFVDVPKAFQGIIDEWAKDRKADTASEVAQRERSSKSAYPEFPAGPSPFAIDAKDKMFENWDDTEAGFAAALERAR